MPSCQAWNYSHQSSTVLTKADRWHIKQQNMSGTGTKLHACGQLPPPGFKGWTNVKGQVPQDVGAGHRLSTWRNLALLFPQLWCLNTGMLVCFLLMASVVCSFYGSAGSGTCDSSSLSPLVPSSLWVTLELLLTAVSVFTATESFDCLVLICRTLSEFRENSAFQTTWANFL